jgi:DNA-binding IclR family transcriptional regulator
MMSADQSIPTLTKPQADCLLVLRNPGYSQSKIAIAARLDLKSARTALRKLEELGLARQTGSKLWLATTSGETCNFETIPDRPKRRGRPPGPYPQLKLDLADRPMRGPASAQLGPSARRLLDLLDRPTHGRALAQRLGFSRQRVRQLLLSLHAQGRISFGDPDHPSWLVKRAGDDTPVLSRDKERALAALPLKHVTDARRLGVAAGLSDDEAERILGSLTAAGLAEALDGSQGGRVFRITAAGLEHPQYVPSGRRAPPPRLPVQSDRVRKVLRTISDAGALRIRDVKDLTKIPQRSINALMQYLKRKRLVAKAGDRFDAPYALTERGRATLAEMTLRQAA